MIEKLIQGIDTIIVRVSEFAASKSWYTEKLGFNVTFDEPNMKLAVLDTFGPTSLTIWQTDSHIRPEKEVSSYPIFKTPDAAALRRILLEKEITADEIITDDYVTYFRFFDPDGNVLEACQVHG